MILTYMLAQGAIIKAYMTLMYASCMYDTDIPVYAGALKVSYFWRVVDTNLRLETY